MSLKTAIGNVAEVLVVITIGLGLFIYSSWHGVAGARAYNSADFYFIIFYEVIALAIIAAFLKYRKWTISDFNLQKFALNMFAVALLLVIARQVVGIGLTKLLTLCGVIHSSVPEPAVLFQQGLISTILIIIVNSVHEEVILVGYFFKRFEKLHPAGVILLSFIVRASFHTYQGWGNMPMVFSLALVFGLYYVKYKRLWPLIIAHGMGNTYSFLSEYYGWVVL